MTPGSVDDLLADAVDVLRTRSANDGRPPSVVLARRRGLRIGLRAPVAPARADDRTEAELAVWLSAVQPQAAAYATSAVLRDGDTRIGRRIVAVGIDVSGGGHRLAARVASWDDDDPSPIDVAVTPTASLLFDAVVRTRCDLPLAVVSAVLQHRGHVLLAPDDVDVDPVFDLLAPTGPDVTAGAAAYGVDRLSRELARRHRPTARVADRRTAPGVPCDAPPGWVAACPI